MQITLDTLALALAPIEAVGKGEMEFDVGGTTITLRILLPEEEAEVQKHANAVLADGDDGKNNAMEYLERFKLGILSYAVCAVGTQDLRDAPFIETGEKLANGTAVKIPRVTALRQLIGKWSNPIRLALFRKYTDLVVRVEKQAEAAIKFDPTDIDAEIERLEERLAKLKETKGEQTKGLETDMARMVKSVADEDARKAAGRAEQPVADDEPTATTVEEQPAAPPIRGPRTPVTPSAAVPVSQAARPVTQARPAPVSQTGSDAGDYAAGMDVPDSMVGDGDALEEAVAAENLRLIQMRRGASSYAPAPSALTAP